MKHQITKFKHKSVNDNLHFLPRNSTTHHSIHTSPLGTTTASWILRVLGFFGLVFTCLHAEALGWVDIASTQRYTGWACKSGTPEQVGVHIWRDDNVFLGGGSAKNFREFAVQTACGSTHQYHGFDITITVPPHLLDGTTHSVRVFSIYADGSNAELANSPVRVQFGSTPPPPSPPTDTASVVGRDLAYPVVSVFGHIGIWDGANVVEMLNEGTENKVKLNTWANFWPRSKPWAHATPNISTHLIKDCFGQSCIPTESQQKFLALGHVLYNDGGVQTHAARQAIFKRAQQIQGIGATYTYSADASIVKALPEFNVYSTAHCSPFSQTPCDGIWIKTKKQIGTYRCDTLVATVYAGSALSAYGYGSYETIYRAFSGDAEREPVWRAKMTELADRTLRTPVNIYNKIKSY